MHIIILLDNTYLLGCYYEPGHSRYEDRNLDAYMHKAYLSETGKLKRFIATYEKYCWSIGGEANE